MTERTALERNFAHVTARVGELNRRESCVQLLFIYIFCNTFLSKQSVLGCPVDAETPLYLSADFGFVCLTAVKFIERFGLVTLR